MQPIPEAGLQLEIVAILVREQEVAPGHLRDAWFATTQSRFVEFVDEAIEPVCVSFAYPIDIADVGQGVRQCQCPIECDLQLRRTRAEVRCIEAGVDQCVAVAAASHRIELRGDDGVHTRFMGVGALQMCGDDVDRAAAVRDFGQRVQCRQRKILAAQQGGSLVAKPFRTQAFGDAQRDFRFVLLGLQGFVQAPGFRPPLRAPQQSGEIEARLAVLGVASQCRAPVRFGVGVAEQFQRAIAASVQRGRQIATDRCIVRTQGMQSLQCIEQGIGVVEPHRGIGLDRQCLDVAGICRQQRVGVAQGRGILTAHEGRVGAVQQHRIHAQAIGASARPSLAPLSRPSSALIHCPVATRASRSMPVAKPMPCSM